jgi:hypothetical protein
MREVVLAAGRKVKLIANSLETFKWKYQTDLNVHILFAAIDATTLSLGEFSYFGPHPDTELFWIKTSVPSPLRDDTPSELLAKQLFVIVRWLIGTPVVVDHKAQSPLFITFALSTVIKSTGRNELSAVNWAKVMPFIWFPIVPVAWFQLLMKTFAPPWMSIPSAELFVIVLLTRVRFVP